MFFMGFVTSARGRNFHFVAHRAMPHFCDADFCETRSRMRVAKSGEVMMSPDYASLHRLIGIVVIRLKKSY